MYFYVYSNALQWMHMVLNTGSLAHVEGPAWEHRQFSSHVRAITWKLVPHASGRYPSSPFWRTSNVLSAGNAPGLAPHSTGSGPDKLFAETTRVSKEARAPGIAHAMGREPAGHARISDTSLGAGQGSFAPAIILHLSDKGFLCHQAWTKDMRVNKAPHNWQTQ